MSIQFLTWLSTYIIIVLCELGDKTQVAVLLFTSNNPRKKWTVFIASALALVLCVIVEVTAGVSVARL
jgi:putative Ca2+/H+ antiporter (TMEM165/GDT1 family)